MKFFKLLFSLTLVLGIFYALNTKLGSVPALGKFLNPASGIWQNETDESITGEIQIPGLSDIVTVHYDEEMVPHVFAQNEHDLYKAQGYLTAKHRLWQMEFQTYAAAGRLSEIVGESALDYDRTERRRGMGFGADNTIEHLEKYDPEVMSYIQDYADGVNAYINQLDPADYPVEYKLLDYAPEEWKPKKTALLLMYMTKMLAGYNLDLEQTNIYNIFGEETFNLLFPRYFEVYDPIIPRDTDWSFIDVPQTELPESRTVKDTFTSALPKPDPNNGSNNWAVSGAKSTTGHPILANDPHLGLNLPSIWFMMQLNTPEHKSIGATIPGALGVISGYNEHISFGETNARRDLIDWYKIAFNKDRTKYKYDGEWKEVKVRVEEIKIKGKETYIDSVLYTHHGPVVFDKNFKSDNGRSGYAMRWIGHDGGKNQRTFIELNRAKNYDDFVNAIQYWDYPAQNFVFASTEGDIAMWVQGKFPNRWDGQGTFVMDGSNPDNDWPSYIPQKFNAYTKNPERGFVSSANQHPVDENYPYKIPIEVYGAYRGRVINDFFRSKEKFSVDDFKVLHNNNYNLIAFELLPFMMEQMDTTALSEEEMSIYNELKNWKFNNDSDEVAPSIWREWYSTLTYMIFDELDREDVELTYPRTYQVNHLLKHYGDHKFMDIIETEDKVETARDLFLLSFKEATKKILAFKKEHGHYKWSAYKGTRAGHLLQALPAFSRFDLPVGGGASIVNASRKTHGASWRMIVEMSSPPKGLGIYPGGQSGNPGSKYYDNLIDDWAEGKYNSLNFMLTEEPTENIIGTLILKPRGNE